MKTEKERLIEAIQHHKLAVVADLPQSSQRRNELSQQSLTEELSKKYLLPKSTDFKRLLQYLVKRQGRKAFVSLLYRLMCKDTWEDPWYYALFREMGVKYVIDTHYFPLWRDRVLDSDNKNKYAFYNYDEDFSIDGDQQIVVSLFGDINDYRDKIILTESELNGFFGDYNNISPSLRSILQNTMLFINFDPNADQFKRIYDYLCQRRAQYPAEAFLISDIAPEDDIAYGADENLSIIIHESPLMYLNEIASQLRRNIPRSSDNDKAEDALPDVPYKYLGNYERTDHAIFSGRKKDISNLLLKVRDVKPVVILTSMSGYGKTSLIHAGLIPELEKTGDYATYYIRSGSNPWENIVKTVFSRDAKCFSPNEVSIREISGKPRQLIIIDQFEEFFVNATEETRLEVNDKLEQMLQKYPTLTILFSIRQDFYSYLTKYEFLSRSIPQNAYSLDPLTVDNARAAILRPTQFPAYHFSFEDGLVDRIIADLSFAEEKQDKYVDPSQLQIVCYFLYRELQNKDLDMDRKAITAEMYQAMGGANGILENYIDESFKTLGERERNLGKNILKCLVTSMKTRSPKTVAGIVEELSATDRAEDVYQPAQVEEMVKHLVDNRLLKIREIEKGEKQYELTHEYIIRKISEWIDTDTFKFKEACELFRGEFRQWSKYRTYMKKNVYDEVRNYREKIKFSTVECAYALLSLINYGEYDGAEMNYWISRIEGDINCFPHFEFALDNFKGKRKLLTGLLMSVLFPSDNVNEKICNALSGKITPHLITVVEQIKDMGRTIDESLMNKLQDLLDEARKINMLPVTTGDGIQLGLSAKECNILMRKYEIGKRMKPFFPQNVRVVTIPTFYIDKYTVTNEMYAEFHEEYHYPEDQADYPVTGLTFDQAKEYANWWGKDLPTEDEWEYAARGDKFKYFPWGNDWDFEAEKVKEESEKLCNTSLTGTDGTRSAKAYPRGESDCGCYNMAGNVWEWTKTPSEADEVRVIVKGGSWSQQGIMPWAWYRYTYQKTAGYSNVGFRCVYREHHG